MRATAAVLLLAALALGVGAQRRKQLTDDNFEGVTQVR